MNNPLGRGCGHGNTVVNQAWQIGDCEVRFSIYMRRPLDGERWPDVAPVVEAIQTLLADWAADTLEIPEHR